MARHAWCFQDCVICAREEATGAREKGEANLVQGEATWGDVPLLALVCCSSEITALLHRTWPRDLPLHPLCSNTSVELSREYFSRAGKSTVQTQASAKMPRASSCMNLQMQRLLGECYAEHSLLACASITFEVGKARCRKQWSFMPLQAVPGAITESIPVYSITKLFQFNLHGGG